MIMSNRSYQPKQPSCLFRAWLLMLIFSPVVGICDTLFIVKRHGSVVITNRPASLDYIIAPWRPASGPQGIRMYWKRSPHNLRRFNDLIASTAAEHGVPPALIKAIVHAESSFNPYARSPKGAMGLMQLMPATARRVGVRYPFEPAENIRGGTAYFAGLLRKYRGDVVLSLAAYNAGPGAVADYRGVPPFKETRRYVQRVLALAKAYARNT